jgi:MFS transporter, DHA2 family, methylenomycin A resistance protein
LANDGCAESAVIRNWMPSSLSLIRAACTEPAPRGRAIAAWTMARSVAAAAGPVAGGALNLVSRRMIFFIDVPVCAR